MAVMVAVPTVHECSWIKLQASSASHGKRVNWEAVRPRRALQLQITTMGGEDYSTPNTDEVQRDDG